LRLEGKVALVTGGGRGIGKGISMVLAREGADIVVNYVSNPQAAQDTVDAIKKLGRRAIAVQADVSQADDVDALVEKTLSEMGTIDILVNNAGIRPQMLPTTEQSVEAWDKVVSTNLGSAYRCSRRVGQWMVSQNYGRIVNISSLNGMFGNPMRTDYGPAKAGMINLTHHLAVEWARYNIRVNCLSAGYVATEMVQAVSSKSGSEKNAPVNLEMAFKRIPMARMASPEEVGKVVLFLASDDSSFVTGVNIPVDGGWSVNLMWNFS
jgi:3-oxoacyl-[acyl-carrier protein] reductase